MAGCCTGVKELIILSQRKDDDAARVLARGPADADAALHNAVDLAVALGLSMFLVIIFHVAVGRLIRQGADGARPEGLSFSENDFRVIVGLALVLSGEIQVDIRLLVSLKSQEGLKGDIKAILF